LAYEVNCIHKLFIIRCLKLILLVGGLGLSECLTDFALGVQRMVKSLTVVIYLYLGTYVCGWAGFWSWHRRCYKCRRLSIKIKTMKNIISKLAVATAALMLVAQVTKAVPVTGAIGFTGQASFDTSSAGTATEVTSW
jgi:hypothetical protein